jgi:hypothetical protein
VNFDFGFWALVVNLEAMMVVRNIKSRSDSMVIRYIIASISIFVGLLLNVQAQGFQNLGFESNPAYAGTDSDGFPIYTIPHWTVDFNNTPQSGVNSNLYVLDYTTAALFIGSSAGVIDGNQSVFLAASSYEAPVDGISSESIFQTGTVPITANSIQFKLTSIWGFGGTVDLNQPQNNFFIAMNSQIVPLQVTAKNGSYLVLAGDVSQWAGQTAQLSIGVGVPSNYNGNYTAEILYSGVIDSVVFSPTSVPEPSILVLSTIGVISAWMVYARRKVGFS